MSGQELRQTEHGVEFIAEVVESWPLTPSAHGIKVTKHPDFDFEPVQYTYLSLRTDEEDEPWSDYRPMSLATSPTRPHLEYGVRLGPSAWKRAFAALEPGDHVMVEGPAGHFVLDTERPAVLVAGGIGITPLKGMAEYATDADLDIPVRLIYANRSPDEIAYRHELDELAATNPNMRITYTITRPDGSDWSGPTGRIDAAMLDEATAGLDDPVHYLCGTPDMVDDLRRALAGSGVPDDRVTYEAFWGYQ